MGMKNFKLCFASFLKAKKKCVYLIIFLCLSLAPMSPGESSFVFPNKTSATLLLSTWQSGGCPIRHFVVKYRPKYESQWTTIAENLDMPKDVFVLRHLEPEKEYVVMVTAHSEAGLTQGEYSFRTLPSYTIGTNLKRQLL